MAAEVGIKSDPSGARSSGAFKRVCDEAVTNGLDPPARLFGLIAVVSCIRVQVLQKDARGS